MLFWIYLIILKNYITILTILLFRHRSNYSNYFVALISMWQALHIKNSFVFKPLLPCVDFSMLEGNNHGRVTWQHLSSFEKIYFPSNGSCLTWKAKPNSSYSAKYHDLAFRWEMSFIMIMELGFEKSIKLLLFSSFPLPFFHLAGFFLRMLERERETFLPSSLAKLSG